MFPVKLRLLSELDIVKILTNTYYADCHHLTPPDENALAARVDALGEKAKGEPWRASFSEDDMIDLKEYVTRNFRATAVVQRLEHLYWPKAIHAAGRLAPEDRAALFEILWDEAKPFTALYLRLSGVLDALGYPDEAFCGKEALLPPRNQHHRRGNAARPWRDRGRGQPRIGHEGRTPGRGGPI